ncbi:MAG TPA: alkaline phosphatase family protein [Bryobacteraceae bacterium]|nr:alkaline phosphatase family protein [Bryobacteraceae bacterium]
MAALLVGLSSFAPNICAQNTTASIGRQSDGSIILPNGQTITPTGTQVTVNDRPLGITVSPDNTTAVVVTASNFKTEAIHFIDLATQTVVQTINGNTFVGVAFSPDGKTLYVGGGTDNNVKVLTLGPNHQWSLAHSVAISGGAPSGLSLSPTGDKLYVALNKKEGLGIIDTKSLAVTQVTTGAFPYTTVTSADGGKVYVSNWGGRLPEAGDATDGSNPVVVDPATGIANNGTVSVYDTHAQAVVSTIQVGLHPSAMALSPDGTRLYVANAESDSISIVSTGNNAVTDTIDLRPYSSAPLGSVPNAIAVTKDGSTLYVANGGNNAVAVVQPDYRGVPVRGFIPAGWFPAAVALTKNEDRLLIGTAYGFGSIATAPSEATGRSYQYRDGEVSIVPLPVPPAQLKSYTAQVTLNNATLGAGKSPSFITPGSPVPAIAGQGSPIKHVIFIIKENRTYDQVFGDIGFGDGDPALALFGASVTPNAHALASQYVLFDNYYAAGDQSSLGHQWCDEAWAADYSHKYGNGRNDYAGTNPMAFAPTGFLWDNAQNNGHLTARIYGEFTNQNKITPSKATWSQFYDAWLNHTALPGIVGNSSVKSAQRITAHNFPGFQLQIPDQVRADLFINDFKQWDASKSMPNLVVMLLPDDHTQGTSEGYPTPASMVADNDLAVGRIVDAVSHSSQWASTAIFVTEDDSQDGVDHVDGHRGPILVVSPYTRRSGAVDSTFYSTPNIFRTIEQILGLPPLNQYDKAAQTMAAAFSSVPDITPFEHVPNLTPLNDLNPSVASLKGVQRKMALASMAMNFSEPDAAPEDQLNRIIWWSVKGYDTPYPTFKHRESKVTASKDKDSDDDR